MSLYDSWRALAEQQMQVSPAQGQTFWNDYYALEKGVYAKLLGEGRTKVAGKVSDLAAEFELEPVIFAGFLDGINESIEPVLKLDTLEEDTEISFDIDLEKLFYNMLNAKAEWLHGLPEWDKLLSPEQRDGIRRKWRTDKIVRVEATPGRNDPCPCGSGKKYKKCCGANVNA